MTKREKLIARISARPAEADFEDVRALLEEFGYRDRGGKGSHHVFVKANMERITVATVKGRRVKRVYLNIICDKLGLNED